MRWWMRSHGRVVAPVVTAAELAALRAAETQAEVERVRALSALQQEQTAAEQVTAARTAQQARELSQERDRQRAARRQARAMVRGRVLGRVRLLVPLLIVNAAAVYGQIAYALDSIAPVVWPVVARLALAVLFAAAVESIAVYVGWHAHDALLTQATVTAARLRRASYVIAGAVASINYAHFAGPVLAPTAASVAFGLLSLLSPWLWGLHTRRVQHVQLRDEGAVDCIGAVFSAERVRAFPLRSWAARRWSIDHNVTDPAAAWAGYNADRAARRRAHHRTRRLGTAWAALRETTVPPELATDIGSPAAVAAAIPAATGRTGGRN